MSGFDANLSWVRKSVHGYTQIVSRHTVQPLSISENLSNTFAHESQFNTLQTKWSVIPDWNSLHMQSWYESVGRFGGSLVIRNERTGRQKEREMEWYMAHCEKRIFGHKWSDSQIIFTKEAVKNEYH